MSDADSTPTLYEWAGGAEALDRLTNNFYRRVRADPILASVFSNLPDDHPHHVALWLGEVFGGPKTYTEQHGGYSHMLSKHLGLGITEEQRARWVQLVTPAADDAGLPSDPEFRSALLAYVEWERGSRWKTRNPVRHRPRGRRCRTGAGAWRPP